MVNWYYVVGSERVGPVSEAALQILFLNGEINTDTYIWKKGFINWERLRDVTELKFDIVIENTEEEKLESNSLMTETVEVEEKKEITREINLAEIRKEKSLESKLAFDWNNTSEKEQLFFIKIGKDRNLLTNDTYGPYSIVELKEALTEKRINLQTLIYSSGMGSWIKIQNTPVNVDYNGILSSELTLIDVPLILIFESSPTPLVTIVKKAGVKEAVLLGAGPFVEFQNKTLSATLYIGNELKVKNVQVKVQNYDKKDQTIDCHFVDLNSDAKNIMLNHAI